MDIVADMAEAATRFRQTLEDERAFAGWYDKAVPRVYGYLFERSGGIRSTAEELTQDTFVEVVRNRGKFDGRSDPLTWVIGIARRKLADHYRRLAREERRHLGLVRVPGSESDRDAWSASERRQDVLRALRSLPAMQQAALALHYMDDLPVSEVAAELGKSESAVESLLTRGREALRRALPAIPDEVNDG